MTPDEAKVFAQLDWKQGLEPQMLARAAGISQLDCDRACESLVKSGRATFRFGRYRKPRGS